MLDWSEISSIAQTYLDRASVDPYSPIPIIKVAEAAGIIVAAKWNLEEEASIDHSKTPPTLQYRRSLGPIDARGRIAHECGEDWCFREDYWEEDRERVCDAIGACILIPTDGLRRFCGAPDPSRSASWLAQHYVTSMAVVALRLSLWREEPLAIACRSNVVRYGDWGLWVSDQEIRGEEPVPKKHKALVHHSGMRTAIWRKR